MSKQNLCHAQLLRIGVTKRSLEPDRVPMDVDDEKRPPLKKRPDMLSLSELFEALEAIEEDDSATLRVLFTELVEGELPLKVRDVGRVITILRRVREVDQRYKDAVFAFNLCIEFQKDFPGASCNEQLQALESARAVYSSDIKKLTKDLNDML